MGVKIPRKTITLNFADADYEGIEIIARMPTIREAMEGEKLQKKLEGKSESEQIAGLFQYLMKYITSWNLEDEDGNPVPLNDNSLLDFPGDVAWAIFGAFFEGSTGVSAPLAEGSDDTTTSQAVSIPMETL